MKNNFIKYIIGCLFFINSANLCLAEMRVQEYNVSVGYPSTEQTESENNQDLSKTEVKTNENTKQANNNKSNNTKKIIYTPYSYNNNGSTIIYKIGPYPARGYYGITRSYYMPGGYNYKGFSYNYGINKKPIYIKVPVGPFPPNGGQKPPPPQQNKPNHNPGKHHN